VSRAQDGAHPQAPQPPPGERVWPATVVDVVAQRSPIDERAAWVLDLDVRVRTTRGRRQVRRLRYPLSPHGPVQGGALVEAFRALLDREPLEGEEPAPAAWTGLRCGAVLDATWAADGQQAVRVAALRPPGAVTERPDAPARRPGERHAWVAVYRLAPETDGDVVDLARMWLARALRAQAGFRGMAVVRSEPAIVVVLTVWDGAAEAAAAAARLRTWLEERQEGFVVAVEHHVGTLVVTRRG
jgi:heme-degrading monooxygenase HmoA